MTKRYIVSFTEFNSLYYKCNYPRTSLLNYITVIVTICHFRVICLPKYGKKNKGCTIFLVIVKINS